MKPDHFLTLLRARQEMRSIEGCEPPPVSGEILESALLGLFESFASERNKAQVERRTMSELCWKVYGLEEATNTPQEPT